MTESNSAKQSPPRKGLHVGLVPAPELPERVTGQIVGEMAQLLEWHVDDSCSWKVEMLTDPLVGAGSKVSEVLDKAEQLRTRQGWDYVLCITDLPLFRDGHVSVAEASDNRGVAVFSQPTLGISPLKKRMREAILHLVNEMHYGSSRHDRERQQQEMDSSHRSEARQRHGIANDSARSLMGSRFSEMLVPIERHTSHNPDESIDVRFLFRARWRGYLKLLGGMVRANRPWTMMPAFRHICAVAFGTGAYGLVFTSLWILSDIYSPLRFIILMLAAAGSMVAWLIIDHNLWEPQQYTHTRLLTRLYNAATVLTLTAGVGIYYLTMFVLFLVAVVVFVPPSYMGETLHHPVGWGSTALLAWLVTSVATFAGALGAGLESEEAVRNATYGYRQKQRHQKVEKIMQEEEHSSSE